MFRETYGRRLLGTRVEAVLLVQEHEQSLVTTRNEGEAKGDTHSGGGAGPDGSWKRGQRPPPEGSPRGRLESHEKKEDIQQQHSSPGWSMLVRSSSTTSSRGISSLLRSSSSPGTKSSSSSLSSSES